MTLTPHQIQILKSGHIGDSLKIILTPPEASYLLRLMNRGEGSNIRPDPTFTGQDALALAERLKAELGEAEK